MTETMDTTITTNAQGPKSATVDGVSTSQHSLADQIAADKYLLARGGRTSPANALTRVKIVPPGAV